MIYALENILILMGIFETERNITNKISRGGFTGVFLTAMSKSNWVLYVAIGGCIVIFLGVAYWLYSRQPQLPDDVANNQYSYASEKAEDWLAAVKHGGQPPITCGEGEKTPNCSDQYSTSLDLTAQWAAANAARRLVWLTEIQTAIAFFGLLGLGFTVYWTQRNTRAAIEAAHAAKESADATKIQAEILTRESITANRPRIRIKRLIMVKEVLDDEIFTVKIEFTNFGNSFATLHTIGVTAVLVPNGDYIPSGIEYGFGKTGSIKTLQDGQTIIVGPIETSKKISHTEAVSIRNKEKRLICIGHIEYKNEVGRFMRTNFCRELLLPPERAVGRDVHRFSIVDDPEYEYQD